MRRCSVAFRYRLSELDYGGEEREAVLEVLRSEWLSTGDCTARFEEEFAARVGANALAVSSGTAALHLALVALGAGPGDEVIVPSYTFIATVNAIRYTGATPVFADIVGPSDLNLDVARLPALLTERTKGIVAVHVAGYASRLPETVALARDRGLWVVEDAAHALGASLGGQALGTFGDAGCFSFYANKNLVTGEGGMLVARDADLLELARRLRSHGLSRTSLEKARDGEGVYDVAELGFNYRMTEIEAALGCAQLEKLDRGNALRGTLVNAYRERLSSVSRLTLPFLDNPTASSHYIFPTVVDPDVDRDRLASRLADRGVQTSVHFPAVHRFSLYAGSGADLPVTDDVSARELTLPLHTKLSREDVIEICGLVAEELG